MASLNHSAIERFWSKVNKGAANGCWEWAGPRFLNGYGYFKLNARNFSAHRLSWEMTKGPIPSGLEIDHKCYNRGCVRVDHMRLATRLQNIQNLKGATVRSKSGVRGVYWDKSRKKWDALANVDGVRTRVGRFESLDEAAAAITAWRREHMPNSLMDQHPAP